MFYRKTTSVLLTNLLTTTATAGLLILIPEAQAQTSNVPTDAAPPPQASPVGPSARQPAAQAASTSEDIIVTARKREERLLDVPVPVSIVAASYLTETNTSRIQDYYSKMPGLSLALDNRGQAGVAIRGITTSLYGNPTVGITVDDVPFGAVTSAAFQSSVLEFDPNELAQIEVLRGPQGTLYGASSLGGLLKYETISPSLSGFSGRMQVGFSSVANGPQTGHSVSAAANAPLGDTVAVRISGFEHEDPGYVTNLRTSDQGANWGQAFGGHVALLWQPSVDFSLRLSALTQESKTYGSPNTTSISSSGELQQNYIPGTGGYGKTLQAYSLTLNGRVGPLKITSITGYGRSKSAGTIDVTSVLGGLPPAFGQPAGSGVALVEDNRTSKISEELRVGTTLGDTIDVQLGAFYTHDKTDLLSGFHAFNPTSGADLAAWQRVEGPVSYTEYAGFGDVTVHFTDKFDVQVGARVSTNRQTFSQETSGPWNSVILHSPNPVIMHETRSRDSSTTYLVTPRYRISPDLMVYARFASGYRPGGPNSTVTPGSGLPLTFEPDTSLNYELGVKGTFLDGRVTFDSSVYYIDWNKLQVSLVDLTTFQSYTGNAGKAISQGFETSFSLKPFQGFTLRGFVSYTDAHITQGYGSPAITNVGADKGERLPYSTRWNSSLTAEQTIPLQHDLTGFGAVTVTYVGDRLGDFRNGFGGTLRQAYPSYTTADLRAGVRGTTWTATVYATNITNVHGLIAGGAQTLNPAAFTYIRPRSIGVTFSKNF